MTTWIDKQGPAWKARLLEKIAASPFLQEEFARHTDGDDQRTDYALWMMHVDRILARQLEGMTSADMGDFESWSSFESGSTPLDGARDCMEAQDGFSDLVDLLG